MAIIPNAVYTIKEASDILKVNSRKLARVGKKYNIKKVDNRYIFDGSFLIEYFNLDKQDSMSHGVLKVSKDVLELEQTIQELQIERDKLKAEIDFINAVEGTDALERIKELEAELEAYQVSDNERIEVFTNEEYQLFEQRLQEWFLMQKELQHQEKLFNAEKKSLSELAEHYKHQWEYQRKQAERILDMHQQLIDNIQKQSVIQLQRQAIEAKEKNVRE